MDVATEGALLSDIEILDRLVAEDPDCIFVSPVVDPTTQIGPGSLDLRLGVELISTKTVDNTHIDLTQGKRELERQINEYFEKRRLESSGFFVIHPGAFVLASTLEFLRIPHDIAGRLEGRSSLGRLGLQVHATAGFVDPGFEGNLTFELINSGRLPIKIFPGIRLGQICFFRVNHVQLPYQSKANSKYTKPLGVGRSRIHLDPEI